MRRLLALATSVILISAGCGMDSGATLTGSVTYEGTPLAKGSITLTPSDGKGPIAGGEITAGRYSISGLVPGKKQVQIAAAEESGPPLSSADLANAAKSGKPAAPPPKEIVPPNAVGNGAIIEVQAGTHTHDFALKKPGS
ncbi:MAG TPA: hypothetical protein VFB80_21505 [Pirellulaceae bacterium]|nr:hypothetical protein [Pirellulaceae bacterium]